MKETLLYKITPPPEGPAINIYLPWCVSTGIFLSVALSEDELKKERLILASCVVRIRARIQKSAVQNSRIAKSHF
jgi:hypothetical protein